MSNLCTLCIQQIQQHLPIRILFTIHSCALVNAIRVYDYLFSSIDFLTSFIYNLKAEVELQVFLSDDLLRQTMPSL